MKDHSANGHLQWDEGDQRGGRFLLRHVGAMVQQSEGGIHLTNHRVDVLTAPPPIFIQFSNGLCSPAVTSIPDGEEHEAVEH